MTLGQQISLLRKQKNMSQEELAEAMDVSRQAVSKWETGLCSPDTENLIRLATLFEVDVSVLIGSPEMPPVAKKEGTTGPLVWVLSILLAVALCAAAVFAVLWQVEKQNNATAQSQEFIPTYENVTFSDWSLLTEKEVELTPRQQEDLADYIIRFHFTKRAEDEERPILYGGRVYQVEFDREDTHYHCWFTANGFTQTVTFSDGTQVSHEYEVDYLMFYYLDDLLP